ncbi:MAG: hypothetical protein GY866_15225 [Proteobacteria bacterium]|nr:hypothetical protein [Pseudomonadota bacterium]
MTYNFLFLSVLFLIPGAAVYAVRRDLRRVVHFMAVCAVPFALTERFFYPEYWEPKFLFDLIDVLGFGIEDILFVVGLSSFTSTVYAFVFRARYEHGKKTEIRAAARRGLTVLSITFLLVALAAIAEIPMIYGAFFIMAIVGLFVCVRRKDLFLPGLWGGVLSLVVYTLLCLAYLILFPGIFELTWHTERFLDIFVWKIPLEELMYGFAAGFVATVFYPYVFRIRFASA